ncbi:MULTISPECIES: aldose 1-epimerase family protein [unclassified Microbacterium]|uniref:aldose 1-epimerase family protein n=1 Tax=unclassified Microbacterium TaxID=2609290 RepID=UPI00097F44E5|nr:aldose 1-epimerase family protein [Microbacterium sp. JB110]RCS60231.1 galactose mutarotase [Microbacterium sp. JB110]SJM48305.1 Aldose 1-epimerase [Frigoribacterium sp. JB110]
MSSHSPVDPTGQQVMLSSGAVTARIAQVGAALRGLAVDGTDLVAGYPDGVKAPGASGIVLVPWPNRVRDGRWSHNGGEQQLPISEPKFRNASHGLLRFTPYDIEQTDAAATLRAKIFPQNGYPFALDTAVTYALTDDGIRVTHSIRNVGADPAPVAVGTHPYLAVGDADPAEITVAGTGTTWIETDERMLPIAEHPVGEATDLRAGRALGAGFMDRCYANLTRDADGLARTTLTAPDGRATTLWQGEGLDYTHIFITDGYPGRSHAIAIEPMSAPADAFNSGRGLRTIAAGDELTFEWGVVRAA